MNEGYQIFDSDIAVKAIINTKDLLLNSTLSERQIYLAVIEEINRKFNSVNIPLISMVSKANYTVRKNWKHYISLWIHFPVNKRQRAITLCYLEEKRPVASIIYSPLKDILYLTPDIHKAYKIERQQISEGLYKKNKLNERLQIRQPMSSMFFRILRSSKISFKTEEYIKDILNYRSGAIHVSENDYITNLCEIAEGKADLYPYINSISEYKIAPFDALIKACGYSVTSTDGISSIQYNSKKLVLSGFIAKNNYEYDISIF